MRLKFVISFSVEKLLHGNMQVIFKLGIEMVLTYIDQWLRLSVKVASAGHPYAPLPG